jgi:hypothetical protein
MKTITDFGGLVLLVSAFGLSSLSGACIAQSDSAGEASSVRMATGISPAVATVDPEPSTMAPLPAEPAGGEGLTTGEYPSTAVWHL